MKKEWLKIQQQQKDFKGWDFSALKNKMRTSPLPWDYSKIVMHYLKPDDYLLDIGTGGGELLKTFHHAPQQTAVTESWRKNHQLLLETLAPLGVDVHFTNDDTLPFSDETFEIILASQASYDPKEVYRILKKDGLFITQQVGDLNGLVLASKLIPNLSKNSFDWHLSIAADQLKDQGFQLLSTDEAYPKQEFYELESLIYYALTIPWEYPEFSVETHDKELHALAKELQHHGLIYNLQHRFLIVAAK